MDPNRDGVTGNTGNLVVTTAPAGRATTSTLPVSSGATIAGTVLTAGTATGKMKIATKDDATQTSLEEKGEVNPVPLRVSSITGGAAALGGVYGALNAVHFAYSHGKADARMVAEMITNGGRNDFGIIPNGGWHTVPLMGFSAPANSWNDQNYTPTAMPTIDVNIGLDLGG